MIIRYFKPSGLLSRYIKYYWSLETDQSDTNISERVIPTGNIELMFHYGNSFVAKRFGSNIEISQPKCFVSGIDSGYSDISTNGISGMIAVTFFPLAASNFFNFPLIEIENRNVSLDLIWNHEVNRLEYQLCVANSAEERISMIESFLFSKLTPIVKRDIPLLFKGISIINESYGRINATQLASKLSVTTKSLERKSAFFLGKSPKQFIKIVRLQHIIQCFSNPKRNQLTSTALDHGYFDQSHFIKEFKSFTGFAPREFMAKHNCICDYFD
jgi:AraC-like DNA-binding protein